MYNYVHNYTTLFLITAEMFQKLSCIYGILTDPAAKVSYHDYEL